MVHISEEQRLSLCAPSSCSSGTAVHTTSAAIESRQEAVKEEQIRCAEPRKEELVTLVDQTNILPLDKIIMVFLSLGLCVIISALDSVVVATALPSISKDFDAGAIVSWVPAAFLLTSTSFQPIYGRFSDIFGRKPALSLSMVVFMIGNLISGFSKSIAQLIIARGISGAGGGGIISLCQIVISDIVTLRERGKYQGIIGVIIALGYAMGPIIGGTLAQDVSWRWCFWFSIPISLVATLILLFALPLRSVGGSIKEKLLIMDYFGAVLSLVGSTLILLPLIWGGVTFPWKSPEVLITLFCGLFVVVMFILWEWMYAKLPIVPMYIFRHSTVTGVYITMSVNGFVFFSSIYYVPQYLQVVIGDTPFKAGIFLIPYLIGQMVASWISGMLVSITGKYRVIIYTGFALWSIACGLLSSITPSSPRVFLVVYMLLAGIGAGQTLQTTTVAAQASVTRQDVSVVTAFRNFIRLLGGALSLAIGSTIINNVLTISMTNLDLKPAVISAVIDKPSVLASPASIGLSHEDASSILLNGYTRGFKYVFIFNACYTAIATAVSVLMIQQVDLLKEGDSSPTRQGEKSAC